jgi:beta-glucosidase
MAKATIQFPRGFLWGTATAAHQVEGQNKNNNWYAWEEAGHTEHKSGLACDWWGGRWKEDFNRAAETGQNAHRLSVEWSRIQPERERWDENALDRYREMLRGLRDRNMAAMVTLHHFTEPLWFMELGGWESPEAPQLFAEFVRRTVSALKEYATLWVTLNEPNVYAYSGYVAGVFPPGKKDMNIAFKVMANMLRGHALAYNAIHDVQREARVGMAHQYRSMFPKNPRSPLDKWVAKTQSRIFNDLFPHATVDGKVKFLMKTVDIPEAIGTQDFMGLNYYSRDTVSFDLRMAGELFGARSYPDGSDLSETGFIANEPDGFFEALRWANSFGKDIIITENGIEDSREEIRSRYLAQHIQQVWRAVNFNWRVKGYFHWSLVDNFEWERGWTQRFGLWELDVETQKRRKRKAAELYEEICNTNSLSSEMIEKYCPEVLKTIFPD